MKTDELKECIEYDMYNAGNELIRSSFNINYKEVITYIYKRHEKKYFWIHLFADKAMDDILQKYISFEDEESHTIIADAFRYYWDDATFTQKYIAAKKANLIDKFIKKLTPTIFHDEFIDKWVSGAVDFEMDDIICDICINNKECLDALATYMNNFQKKEVIIQAFTKLALFK